MIRGGEKTVWQELVGEREIAGVVVEGVEDGPDEEGVGRVSGADGVAFPNVSFFGMGWRGRVRTQKRQKETEGS